MGQTNCCATQENGMEVTNFTVSSHSAEADGFREEKELYVVISKESEFDKLGMDVKHVRGKLNIVNIGSDGVIAKHNRKANSLDPPQEVLKVHDWIIDVNGVSSDQAMVDECKKAMVMKVKILGAKYVGESRFLKDE
eukprot:CAMPEP_0197659532 /NCGR_PEP_ID=MMETSP1338-20131121/48056_1 /TAXON_ID=43686 ORGANISM="Pelagodinium beii, Strain RCC1491" /NCGR_SAMPLE_ID=MMETSP1338 /ASSEMBLY_ACC=CAM_ASM_000754 /LENGTH=136 /DNA_ID=CAMNT_0043236497 /DNA_START=60 /DNA_END=468 /DNA_ORIENTATION=-